MDVYVLRHGVAVERGTPGYEEDSERPLTVDGKERLKKVARCFSVLEVAPEVIVSSPYVRARQTAEIAARVMGHKRDVVFSDTLTPDSAPAAVWEFLLRQHSAVGGVMLVGHEPQLGHLILSGSGSQLRLELKKAGLCKLFVDQVGSADQVVSIQWILTPGQMRRL